MTSNQRPPSAEELVFGRGDWRRRIAADYAPVAERLTGAYGRVLPTLEVAAGEFAAQLRLIDEQGRRLTEEELRGLTTYQRLLVRVRAEMDDFAAIARNEAGALSETAILSGAQVAEQMVQAGAGRASSVIAAAWNRPDPAALERLIAYVDGEPLRARFERFGTAAAQNLADMVLASVAQGKNPVQIARMITQWYAVPYAWAENMTRTVQIYSYRSATHAAYRANSNVVSGWVWQSALDTRVCMSCLNQHGSFHPLDDVLNDHHRGRCVPVPVVRGQRWHETVETGEQWFNRQPVSDQKQMMGKKLYEAWRRGEAQFKDFSTPYEDEVYGEMLRQATLREILARNKRKED